LPTQSGSSSNDVDKHDAVVEDGFLHSSFFPSVRLAASCTLTHLSIFIIYNSNMPHAEGGFGILLLGL
jgi:hypothetical protein